MLIFFFKWVRQAAWKEIKLRLGEIKYLLFQKKDLQFTQLLITSKHIYATASSVITTEFWKE